MLLCFLRWEEEASFVEEKEGRWCCAIDLKGFVSVGFLASRRPCAPRRAGLSRALALTRKRREAEGAIRV